MREYRTPGYYPDPDDPFRERWWNGQGWSDSYKAEASVEQVEEKTERSEASNKIEQPSTLDGPQRPPLASVFGQQGSPSGFTVGVNKVSWQPRTTKQALIFPILFAILAVFISGFILKLPWLALAGIAFSAIQAFIWVKAVKSQKENPEASLTSWDQILSAASATPPSGNASSNAPTPNIALPSISPDHINFIGKAIKNGAFTFMGCSIFTVVGILMVFVTGEVAGEPSETGGTSVEGWGAIVMFFGFLFAGLGSLAALPAAILAFALTLKKNQKQV